MILCDTGPLVAILDRGDAHHERCVAALADLPPSPLRTTWPCWVEATYLLRRAGGFSSQEKLWSLLGDGLVELIESRTDEWRRLRALMRQYRDVPMDLADASLVAAAEHSGIHRIFTLDSHFYAYRIHGSKTFEIVPRYHDSGNWRLLPSHRLYGDEKRRGRIQPNRVELPLLPPSLYA